MILILFFCSLAFSHNTREIECYQEQESESGDGITLGNLLYGFRLLKEIVSCEGCISGVKSSKSRIS